MSAGDCGGQGGAAADRKADVLHSFRHCGVRKKQRPTMTSAMSNLQGQTEVRLGSN